MRQPTSSSLPPRTPAAPERSVPARTFMGALMGTLVALQLAGGALAGSALAGGALAGMASAQESAPPQGAAAGAVPPSDAVPRQPRFAFSPVEGGALKLDTVTGQVSLCAKGPTGFACTAVPDTRDAYEAEIARLQTEIDRLKGRAPSADAPTGASDLDAVLGYAERLYGRLKQLIDELRAPDRSEPL